MKSIRKWAALFLGLLMVFNLASAAVAEAAQEAQPEAVLAQIGDEQIHWDDVEYMAYLLYYYGYTEGYDYDSAYDRLVSRAVIQNHIRRAGLDQFTDEEMAALQADAAAEWENMLSDYISNNLTEDTEEARAALREEAISYYAGYDYSQDALLTEMVEDAASSKLEQLLLGDYEPSEAEIKAIFEQYGAQYKANYEGNVPMYEIYTNYYGAESWYTPEGYRSVLNLLLAVDDVVMNAYTEAQNTYEEALSAETPDEADIAAKKAALDEAETAVLAAAKADIDAVYAGLNSGVRFEDLLAQYGTDPGMKDEANLAAGYRVHPDSVVYDKAFVTAAFSDKMQAVGDVSDPQVGSYGVYILYYLADVPGGLVMTDEIQTQITEYLRNLRINENYAKEYETWYAEAGVVEDADAYAQAKAAAQAQSDAEAEAEPAVTVAPEETQDEAAATENP